MNSAEMITDQGQTVEELLHSLTEKYRDYLQHPGSSCKIVLKEDGQPDSKVTVALIFQGLEALNVVPRPVENLFVGPGQPKKDSHLNPEGYGLLAREIAALILQRKLLR